MGVGEFGGETVPPVVGQRHTPDRRCGTVTALDEPGEWGDVPGQLTIDDAPLGGELALFETPTLTLPIPPPQDRPARASSLVLRRCDPVDARQCVRAWHSRLPVTQAGPWKLAYVATFGGYLYGGALWHNPSARGLPQDWLELRRLAIPEWAPPHTASWMLGAMRRHIAAELPDVPRLISYQDEDVHTGTIYRAAGWQPGYYSAPRARDRTPNRAGTRRAYRSDVNGSAPAAAGKVRWEVAPRRKKAAPPSVADEGAA